MIGRSHGDDVDARFAASTTVDADVVGLHEQAVNAGGLIMDR